MKHLLALALILGLHTSARADYWALQRAQDQQLAADNAANEQTQAVKGRDDLNRQLTAYVNRFIAAHHGLQSAINSTYGDYGYDVKVSGSIEEMDFTTADAYECKADWGDEYDFEVHIELNCINSQNGKRIDLYPSRMAPTPKKKVMKKHR